MICASRRWRPAARRRPPRPKRKLAALLLVLVLLGSMAYFTVSVLHLITQLAVNSACDLMQLKINAAVTAAQAQVQGDYYTYRTDADGTITAVSIDTEHVGQVSSLVLEHLMTAMTDRSSWTFLLETLFGVNFRPGLKLPLPVRILVLTTSDVSYHNELVSAAINQSKYQLYLNVKMDLDILVPWEHQTRAPWARTSCWPRRSSSARCPRRMWKWSKQHGCTRRDSDAAPSLESQQIFSIT